MKIMRFLFKCTFVITLFIFGISLADKQHLSNNVIVVQIADNVTNETTRQIDELIQSQQELTAQNLCRKLSELGIDARCGSEYFDSTVTASYSIPAGVYDTVYIGIDNAAEPYIQLIATGQIGKNFQSVQNHAARLFQKGYVFFLSLLGYFEKIALNYGYVL